MGLNALSSHSRVLVVEDEPLLRMFSAEMLIDAGFDVVEAANADEALLVLEAADDISVVFTDVEMPGHIDGFALARRIATRWPKIGVVVTSGRRFPESALDSASRWFVAKPFKIAQVVDVIDAFVQARH